MDPRQSQSHAPALDDVQVIDCILAAGEFGDLETLKAWCESLPESSYGQVFIEVSSPEEIVHIAAPAGVSVSWIQRDRPHHRPVAEGDCEIRTGQALARATDAWLDEWLRVDSPSVRNFTMWVGARSNPLMCEFWDRIEHEFTALRTNN